MQAGVLPSGEAVCSVPNTLVALCLNNSGMERVRQTKALACFVPIFTSKAYIKALQADTPQALGAGLDELLRHVGTLRKEGVEMTVDILKQLCEIGGMCCFTAFLLRLQVAIVTVLKWSTANLCQHVHPLVYQCGGLLILFFS